MINSSNLVPILFSLLFCSLISAQVVFIDTSRVDEFISEVYSDVVSDLGYDKPEGRERFLKILSRVEIRENVSSNEVLVNLSEVPVITTYNKNLKADFPFDPLNFNPLKYKLDFYNKSKTVLYRVDNTKYIIIINPEKN